MEKLKKQLEDIKGALPLMIKLGSIDQSAYKTLNEALNEALQQYAVMQRSEQLCGFFEADNKTSSATKCKCGREKWEHPKAT